MTLICIISDTHEHEEIIRKAIPLIKERNPALVLHLGDIVSPPVLEHFEDLPMLFVYGNNDGERQGLYNACAKKGWTIQDTLELVIDDRKIFAAHGQSA